jgi:hypothetical protein
MENERKRAWAKERLTHERESFRFLLPLLLDPKLRERERERESLREIGRDEREMSD